MSDYPKYGHAKVVKRNALLAEIERLRPMLPDTEVTKRNLANIEKHCPIEKMDDQQIDSFVDLLARSVP
jgi:hypothetical protein